MAKASFLKAKVYIEGYGDLQTGLSWLARALRSATLCDIRNPDAGEPKSTLLTPLEVSGWVFHLCRTLFFTGCGPCSLAAAKTFTSPRFPAAWRADADNASTCCFDPDLLISISEATSHATNKYHLGTLLHAMIVMTTTRLDLLPACAVSIQSWLPSHRSDLYRQFNAEIRYATVIERLLPFPTPPTTPIYRVALLGDSHILPAAWRTWHDRDQRLLQLHPHLVMGLKAWHFNPALTTSRERDILARTLPSLSKGCPVIVSAGEIDLREDGPIANLPAYCHASRPAKYASTTEALEATMEAFVSGLVALQEHVDATVVVQSVRPPPRSTSHLELICSLVQQWNANLMAAVAELEHITCMHLPELGESLDGSIVLREEYDIQDGFHLNRAYLPLLEAWWLNHEQV